MNQYKFCKKLDYDIPQRVVRGFLNTRSLIWDFQVQHVEAPWYFVEMLTLCKNVEIARLVCPDYQKVSLPTTNIPTSLRSLSGRTELFQTSERSPGLTHPIFLQLTHLDLETSLVREWDPYPLRSMTRLTHLHLEAMLVRWDILLPKLDRIIHHIPSQLVILVVEGLNSVGASISDEFIQVHDGKYDSRLLIGMANRPNGEHPWILETRRYPGEVWLDDDFGFRAEPITLWGRAMKLLKKRNMNL
ncbi:hypothetical protein DL96DRAFT_852379 [Flagelloscypha sp. PMI_526]|nr:hypothetical protein DL96DRAFT_852379 [Flagelloscypha sp. PMI_526]